MTGLRWWRGRPRRAIAGDSRWRTAALAGGFVVLVAAISPVLAMQLDRANRLDVASIPLLELGPDCADLPIEAPAPLDIPGNLVTRRIACDGLVFDLRLDVFGARSTAAPVLAAARRLAILPNPTNDEDIITETNWLPLPGGPQLLWRLTRTTEPGPMIAVAIWVDGKPATGGFATREHLAWTSLAGARIAPVVVAVAPEMDHVRMTPASMKTIEARLAATLARADISKQIERVAATR